jgi:hypothetical protein
VDPFAALKQFFAHDPDIVSVFLYGQYDNPRTWPDSDIEIAILFHDRLSEDDISGYMERLGSANPLGDAAGILMPFPLNTHILPVVHEVLTGASVLVDNNPAGREVFTRQAMMRLDQERPALLEEAKEAVLQARGLGGTAVGPGVVLPEPPKYLDPMRIGWRLGRILNSVAVLEPSTREPEPFSSDPERIGQAIGWFNNAAGAATGIVKAMLNIFGMSRPSRRWEVFLPLADAKLIPTELALQMGAMVESRWQLITGTGLTNPERIRVTIRSALPPVVMFARLAAWFSELPGGKGDQRVH